MNSDIRIDTKQKEHNEVEINNNKGKQWVRKSYALFSLGVGWE